jgi:hypothetical protein
MQGKTPHASPSESKTQGHTPVAIPSLWTICAWEKDKTELFISEAKQPGVVIMALQQRYHYRQIGDKRVLEDRDCIIELKAQKPSEVQLPSCVIDLRVWYEDTDAKKDIFVFCS